MGMIFISHAAADRRLAEFIETAVRGGVEGADVFRTTRVDQIPSGEAWLEVVERALADAEGRG